MEQPIAILMADLSGYTALTETHGAQSAADTVDKYIRIARQCLVGDSWLHERTGDELMIVSASADNLLATAVMLGNYTAKEEHFLQVHGGMHVGPVLRRDNHFFGSAVNLVSRIAAKADAGRFWCSEDFKRALSSPSVFNLKSKGTHSFKNIHAAKEVFELVNEDKLQPFIDPVCRMLIHDTKKAIPHNHEPGTYFCSIHCSETYSIHH